MRSAIVDHRIDPCQLLAEVAGARHGATVLFVGTVREMNDGAAVTALDYSAYGAMATRELNQIVYEAVERWPQADVVAEHRVGMLQLGDVSVAVAAAHAHRGEAFDAGRYVIEELKKRLPVWKREHYADGRREWVANTTVADAGRVP